MKTYMANPADVPKKWFLVDATDMVLGRLASQAAAILKGKHKPEYMPNEDMGDHVIVINCDKVRLTGKKLDKKHYKYFTGHVGGLREIKYSKVMEEKPDFAVMKAVKGMLPRTTLGRQMLKKLRVYTGSEHEHTAQKPESVELRTRIDG